MRACICSSRQSVVPQPLGFFHTLDPPFLVLSDKRGAQRPVQAGNALCCGSGYPVLTTKPSDALSPLPHWQQESCLRSQGHSSASIRSESQALGWSHIAALYTFLFSAPPKPELLVFRARTTAVPAWRGLLPLGPPASVPHGQTGKYGRVGHVQHNY